jgi:Tol biopolymer transport system component
MLSTNDHRSTRLGCVILFALLLAALIPSGSSGLATKRKSVGAVTQVVSSQVRIGNHHLQEGKQEQPLYPGDALNTDKGGLVYFTLRSGKDHLDCYTKSGPASLGALTVAPKPNIPVNFRGGRNFCKTPTRGGQERWTPQARGARLVFRDPVFEVVVDKRRSLVKVRRGVVVVSGKTGLEHAVVIGRNQQAAVATNSLPSDPAAINGLTPSEQVLLGKLEASLPPVRDKTPPKTTIVTGPRDPSSIRSPKFTFAANEPDTIFSCSLDRGDFRLCTTPLRLEGIAPGPHTLAVKATDPTGNVGPTAIFKWTVDSSIIVFTSERDGQREIYSMDPDGRNQRNLSNNKAVDSAPALSPDGKLIAFHSDRNGNFDIYVMNADGSNQRQLTHDPAFDLNPTWSPDGKQLAFESARDGNSELYAMNADGSGVRRLTTDPAADFDPAWSPDGTRIAFASRRRGGNNDIYVMNADGSNQKILDSDPHVEYNPAWSPDSRQIAFHSDREGGSSQIWLINADGTGLERLTHTSVSTGASDYNPVWAPDGATLAFQSNLHGNDDIYILNVDGTDLTQLTKDPAADLAPDW